MMWEASEARRWGDDGETLADAQASQLCGEGAFYSRAPSLELWQRLAMLRVLLSYVEARRVFLPFGPPAPVAAVPAAGRLRRLPLSKALAEGRSRPNGSSGLIW